MNQPPHIVSVRKPGKPVRHYVYAWRGGPQIASIVGGPKPKLTGAMIDAIAVARAKAAPSDDATVKGLITAYRASPEWNNLSENTRTDWLRWLDRIDTKFGKAKAAIFNDRRIRGDVLDWRDGWADRPRSADMAIQVLSRLISWSVDRGKLLQNNVTGFSQLYDANRADVIWTQAHFDAFNAAASVEVREAVELAACTGLRRGDLVEVPWDAVGPHAIIWKTNKSRGRNQIVVPLLPEAKAVMERIKARHAAEMEAKRKDKRVPLPATILSNSRWVPWTPKGFGSRFNDAKNESKIDVHLHDLRGTFATRCMIAGLTDDQIADILGWNTKDVASIRIKYVDQARTVVALAERISAARA